MKPRVSILLFVLLCLGVHLSAQEITKKRGKYKFYYPSGKMNASGKVKNYHRNGKWTYYDEEGRVVATAYFVLDTINGPYTEFHPQGQVSTAGTYCMNRKCGNWKFFAPDGQLLSDEHFDNGKSHGAQRYWYAGGKLRDSIVFSHGELQYKQSWHRNGTVKEIETYENGLPEGRWTVYPELRVDTFAQSVDDYHEGKRHGWHYQWNGRVLIEAYHYKNGLPDGTFTRYDIDGHPTLVQMYTEGRLDGITTFYKDGRKLLEVDYKDDSKNGEEVEYNRNEKVSKRSWYADGLLDSSCTYHGNGKSSVQQVYDRTTGAAQYTEWNANGELLMTGTMQDGKRTGEWKTYYRDRKLRSVTHYSGGRLEGVFTRYYANGRKMVEYTFLPDGTNTEPLVWNESGKKLKTNSVEYDNIVAGNKPGEVFSPDERPGLLTRRVREVEGDIYSVVPPAAETIVPADTDQVFTFCEVMPQFPGGMDSMHAYLRQNLRYPAGMHDFYGALYVSYIVERNGQITNVKIEKSAPNALLLEQETIRVVSSFPAHSPGMQNGTTVRTRVTIPVRFMTN